MFLSKDSVHGSSPTKPGKVLMVSWELFYKVMPRRMEGCGDSEVVGGCQNSRILYVRNNLSSPEGFTTFCSWRAFGDKGFMFSSSLKVLTKMGRYPALIWCCFLFQEISQDGTVECISRSTIQTPVRLALRTTQTNQELQDCGRCLTSITSRFRTKLWLGNAYGEHPILTVKTASPSRDWPSWLYW